MRLTDLMSHLDLAVYPMLALVIFGGVFVLVIGRVWRQGRALHRDYASIPLDEPAPTAQHDQEHRP